MNTVNFPLLLSAVALLICIFSFLYFRSYLKRRTGQERILLEFREEVDGILKTINETTYRDISLIEEREKNLNKLLSDIDRRLTLYTREMEVRKKAEDAYTALSKTLPPQEKKPETPVERALASRGSYLELGKNRYKTPQPAPVLPEIPAIISSEKTPSAPSTISIEEQILSYLQAGLSVPLIASRLGKSIAEVELAAALLERRGK